MKELPKVVAGTPVGKSVPLVILRNGKELTLNVTLGELELAEKENLIGKTSSKNSKSKDYAKLGNPLMGICLGMQMLGSESSEFGKHPGLDLISGNIVKIPQENGDGNQRKVPFVGWAELVLKTTNRHCLKLFSDLPNNASIYLVHSYHFSATNEQNVVAYYDYNELQITAAVQHENIIGLQFHPEKSSQVGLNIIKNFISL